ncbi:MAG: DNA repair protein RecO [Eubacteriales bacterium]|nr:DNA repair protein RecO [Eubacteriales bacterium]
MPYEMFEGIVLRRNNYRDNDRIITLLTPDKGRVDANARGSRKLKSPLLAATEPATYGEFVLYKGKGNAVVHSFTLKDNFFNLRKDINLLSHASIVLSSCLYAASPEQEATKLFILSLRTLSRLCYSSLSQDLVTSAFLLHFSSIEGFKPRLMHCSICQKTLLPDERTWLDHTSGGLVCINCLDKRKLPFISPVQAAWLRQVLKDGVDKSPPIDLPPLKALKNFVEHYLDKTLPDIMDA